MYLSKLDLDVAGRAAQRYMANPNTLHGALCAAANNSREAGQLLYRLVNERNRNAVYVYSGVPLDSQMIPRGLTMAGQRDLTDWIENLGPGTVLAFDVIAAPTKKVWQPGTRNSKRVLLREQAERLDWIRKRFEGSACRILEIHENEHKRVRVRKGKERRSFYLAGYRYSGWLQVAEPPALKKLLEEGIGSEKAYGYGMLLVGSP